MKLLVDMFACQTGSRLRGIGRYTYSLIHKMVEIRGDSQVSLLANPNYNQSYESLRQNFYKVLPIYSFLPYFYAPLDIAKPDGDPFREGARTLLQHAYQTATADCILYPSIMEGWGEKGCVPFPKNGFPNVPCVAIVYDFIPYIFSEHFLDSDLAFKKAYLYRLDQYKKFDLLLSISESTRQDAINILHLPEDKVINISGSSSDIFVKKDFPKEITDELKSRFKINKPFIFYPGHGEFHKNFKGLLEAYSKLPSGLRSEYQLVLTHVGSATKLQKLLMQFNIDEENVVVTGHISNQEMIFLYNMCYLFIFPSLYEGFGLPVLEAMSCGAPVIASNTSSLPEIIDREDALFNPHDSDDMMHKMQQALIDKEFREDLSAYGIKQAEQFSWEKTADKAWSAINNLVNRGCQVSTGNFIVDGRKPKIAYVFSSTENKTGIMSYVIETVILLRKYFDIYIFVDDRDQVSEYCRDNSFPLYSWNDLLQLKNKFDTVVYHIGNEQNYSQIIKLNKQKPGVVILHDFFLGNLYHSSEASSKIKPKLIKDLRELYGLFSEVDFYQKELGADIVKEWPLNWTVLKYAKKVIMHSNYNVHLLKKYYRYGWEPKVDILSNAYVIKSVRRGWNKTNCKENLGFPANDFVLGCFGNINKLETFKLLIKTFEKIFSGEKNIQFVFVSEIGVNKRDLVENYVKKSKLASQIAIVESFNDRLYEDCLLALDLAIYLNNSSDEDFILQDLVNLQIPVISDVKNCSFDENNGNIYELNQPIDESLEINLIDILEKSREKPKEKNSILSFENNQIVLKEIVQNYRTIIEDAISTDDRKLFRSIINNAEEGKFSESVVDSFAKYAAANLNLRSNPRLLIDVSNISQGDAGTGIQRVVKNVIKALYKTLDYALPVEIVRISGSQLFSSNRFAEKLFNLENNQLGEDYQINIQLGDVMYMLDSSWHLIDKFVPIFEEVKLKGGKVISIVHDLIPINFPETCDKAVLSVFEHWLQTAITHSDILIGVSKSTIEDVKTYVCSTGLANECQPEYEVIPNGVSFSKKVKPTSMGLRDKVQKIAQGRNKNLFLMVGTIEPRKNHSYVLDVFEKLWEKDIDCQLCIVGRLGWNVQGFADRIRNHPERGKRFFFIENATDEELQVCYSNATALITASIAEGFGLPIIEAAMHNTPVIASDIPVFHEVAGEGAFYFSLGDHQSLIDVINKMRGLSDEELEKMVEKIKWITWEENVEQLLSLIVT